MIRALVPAAALLALTACNSGASAPDAPTVQVADAVCRPTPKGRHATGCYLTLTASANDRLTAVTAPEPSRVQIHESRLENNMMVMGQLPRGLALPAGEAVVFAPGGNHLMLQGLKEPLVVGDTLTLTLMFRTAAPMEVTATVGEPAIPAASAAAAQ